MYIAIAFIGFVLLALVAILDKIILTKTLHKPAVFVFYSTIFVLPVLVLVPFGVRFLSAPIDWLAVVLSGAAFAAALWTMYRGFQASEVSHVGPLVGAATAFFVLLLGNLFLSEPTTPREYAGITILILGCCIISFEQSRRHNGWHRGMLWGVAAGWCFAVSHVAAKYVYDLYGFYSGFVWTRGAIGLVGVGLLGMPTVLRSVFSVFVRQRQTAEGSSRPSIFSRRFFLIATDKMLGVLGVVLIQYATAIGNVAVVNALHGVQYGVLVAGIAFLSRFFPSVIREQYGRHELARELVAVALIAIGVGLLIS